MAGTKEGSRVRCESSCRELLGELICRRNECICFPVCLCAVGTIVHVRCTCTLWVLRARSQHLQSDTPPSQSQSREDVFLSSRSDVWGRRLNHPRPIWTPPLTLQVNMILQGVFNGQWRVPMRLRKPLIQMFSRYQQQFFRRQMHLVIQRRVKLVQSLTRT